MASHLLHIDSSIQARRSISRRSAPRRRRLARRHQGGTVTYRDWAPIRCRISMPTADSLGWSAPAEHTPAQATSWALTEQLVDEVKRADTILLGLPVYKLRRASTVKAWVDHLGRSGLSLDPATREGLLGGAT